MQLRHLFPPLDWLAGYRRATLAADLAAGLTVGAVLVPQGMAYALVAGLPPAAGLYASVLPIIIYALLGRSPQLAVGPTAIVSLVVASGLAPLAGGDARLYGELAATLAIMSGVLMLTISATRLGFAVGLLSRPVLSGFTSAAAVIIAASQLTHLVGFDIGSSQYVLSTLTQAVSRVEETHALTLAIGAAAFALLMVLRRWKPRFPWPLLVVIAATAAVTALHLEDHGVRVAGEIPRHIPSPRLPAVTREEAGELVPAAVVVALVALVEAMAMAKFFALKNRQPLEPGREIAALGSANITAGLAGGLPVGGSFSRSAVSAASGARTPLTGVLAAGIVALTLVAAAPLFRPLPRAVLGAVVMMAATGLVDVSEARRLWRVKRSDFHLLVLSFTATLVLGVARGILVALAASFLVVIHQTARPHTALALTREGAVAVLRVDGPVCFANADYIKRKLDDIVAGQNGQLRAVVFDASRLSDMDSSGAAALREMVDDYAARGLAFSVAEVKGRAFDVMRRSGLDEHLGPRRLFPSTDEAVRVAEAGR